MNNNNSNNNSSSDVPVATKLDWIMFFVSLVMVIALGLSIFYEYNRDKFVVIALLLILSINIWVLFLVYRICYYVLNVKSDVGLVPEVTLHVFKNQKNS